MMSPMDELSYFDMPRVTAVVLVPGIQQVLVAEQRRIAVYFFVNAAVGVTVVPGSGQSVLLTGDGFLVPSTDLPLVFRHKDDPGVPQQQWVANLPPFPPPTLTIMEILLRDWPINPGLALSKIVTAVEG